MKQNFKILFFIITIVILYVVYLNQERKQGYFHIILPFIFLILGLLFTFSKNGQSKIIFDIGWGLLYGTLAAIGILCLMGILFLAIWKWG